ncbi:MAG TPA: hypothetical protein VLI04_17550 [Nocardioidaceae bacterium]|nr:hypothetical protein [Nocardioidaceae bacterium]
MRTRSGLRLAAVAGSVVLFAAGGAYGAGALTSPEEQPAPFSNNDAPGEDVEEVVEVPVEPPQTLAPNDADEREADDADESEVEHGGTGEND